MYVAMTRARNHLAVTYPVNVYATRRGSDYSMDQLSRFIDRGVREHMQRVVPREADEVAAGASAAAPLAPPMDLRALLRGRFAPPTHATEQPLGPAPDS